MKTKSPVKRNIQVLISVDEQKLRSQREGINSHFSLKEAIEKEFGWLCESGIYFNKISKRKRDFRS